MSADSLAEGVLKSGDVIVDMSINDVKYDITRQYQVVDLMLDARVGDVVKFNVLREGKSESVSFTVTEDRIIEY